MRNFPYRIFSQRRPEIGQVCLYQAGVLDTFVAAGVEVLGFEGNTASVKLRYVLQAPSKMSKEFSVKAQDLYFSVKVNRPCYLFQHPFFKRITLAIDAFSALPGIYVQLPERRIVKFNSISYGESEKSRIKVTIAAPSVDEYPLIINKLVKTNYADIVWSDLKSKE